jgi:peptidyl-prolyl cis-trans isomerase D
MSVIQKIRDKYARVAVIAIALALLGFIAMDAFTGRGSPFGGGSSSNSVGRVNGTSIKLDKFTEYYNQIEESYKNQGYPAGLARQQAMEQAWNMQVSRVVLEDEFDKLGITVTDKELNNSIIFGAGSEEQLKQAFPEFVNPQTNTIDVQVLAQQIGNIRKKGTAQDKKVIADRFDQLIIGRKNDKYGSLIINGNANVPKWIIEKQTAENSQIAKISFVKKLYVDIPDSSVKVTDEEIQEYINKHKSDFKQTESRSIAYVTFPVVPSASDSAAVKQQLDGWKTEFASTPDVEAYVARTASSPERPVFEPQARLSPEFKDTLKSLPVNGVFGPYIDRGGMVLARMMEKKDLPDSVKCRHILVSVQQGESDSVAIAKIDSIEKAINGGASWEQMAKTYNSDGTRDTKGEMTFSYDQITSANFAPEFAQFILFDGKPGQSKKVKTSFGWHYINIMNWMAVQPYYKIAYLQAAITPSKQTVQEARNNASTFAGEARDEKSFNEAVDKKWRAKGFDKNIATKISPSASSVGGGFMDARGFVRKIYEAKRGEVLQPEEVGTDFVVAVVTGIYEEGTESPSAARPKIEGALRNKKKAELITKDLGSVTTLEAAAAKWNKTIETADSIGIFGGGTLGYEPKVIGAAFNAANRNKVVQAALSGVSGVFVVRVDNVSAVPNTAGTPEERRKQAIMQAKQSGGNPLEGLRNAASITDNRAKHF